MLKNPNYILSGGKYMELKNVQKRDQFIGVRFTEDEKKEIDKYITLKNITITDFIREAVFSHLYNLTRKNQVDFKHINSDIENIRVLSNKLRLLISQLDSEFNVLKLDVNTYFKI